LPHSDGTPSILAPTSSTSSSRSNLDALAHPHHTTTIKSLPTPSYPMRKTVPGPAVPPLESGSILATPPVPPPAFQAPSRGKYSLFDLGAVDATESTKRRTQVTTSTPVSSDTDTALALQAEQPTPSSRSFPPDTPVVPKSKQSHDLDAWRRWGESINWESVKLSGSALYEVNYSEGDSIIWG